MITPTSMTELQLYTLLLESVESSTQVVNYQDTFIISVIEIEETPEVSSEILDEVIKEPYLSPDLQQNATVDVGTAFSLQLGQPTSDYGNDVEIEVDTGSAGFFSFDEAALRLFIEESVTTNSDEGIYVIKISLIDQDAGEEAVIDF